MPTPASEPHTNRAQAAIGLKAAVGILGRWGATMKQGASILRVSHRTYTKAKNAVALREVALDRDQMARVSYLLNIHSALRTQFDNPDNVYGFMKMANYNPFFNGRSPLEIIAGGDFTALYEVFKRIDGLRGAQ